MGIIDFCWPNWNKPHPRPSTYSSTSIPLVTQSTGGSNTVIDMDRTTPCESRAIPFKQFEKLLQTYGEYKNAKYIVPARLWLEFADFIKTIECRIPVKIISEELVYAFPKNMTCETYHMLTIQQPPQPHGIAILIPFRNLETRKLYEWILSELGYNFVELNPPLNSDINWIIKETMSWLIFCWMRDTPVVVILDYHVNPQLALITLENLRFHCDDETLQIFVFSSGHPHPSSRTTFKQWGATDLLNDWNDLCKALSRVRAEMHTDTIMFYDKWKKYYDFTNFAKVEVEIEGVKWKTTGIENEFQAQKFPGNYSLQYDIRQAHYPRDVFNLARKYDQFKRIDWEEQKEGFMTKALDAKFKLDQHRSLYFKLLSTGTAKLHEHTANDMYWGDGGDGGNGVDRLGHLLWRIRGSIREFEERRLKEAGFEVNVAKMKNLWRQIEEERERMIRDIVMVKESLK
ncbi:hypothetical protein BC936DRAFT_144730 [Jimgerdemannia flammicorona]|uniref:NADAR domain-containing protein n=1 Tax=Jimgerdemannia flammicorona TaxID=994334 RepID=A0A433DBU0_9FUNG|nr:hypothetical protein BC936DRAFT_144730 [Jimgerdemannia flammicorona]